MSKIEDLRDEREYLKDEIKTLEIKLKRVNKEISKALANLDGEAYTLPDGRTIKVVRGWNRSYDWSALQNDLDPDVWSEILEPNKAKLDALIEEGKVPLKIVAKHSIKTEREPFVREFGEV